MDVTITTVLSAADVACVEATINPPGPFPDALLVSPPKRTTAAEWIAANVAQLVAQCRSATRARAARAVGLGDLVGAGLTLAEHEAIVASRKKAAALAAAEAAAKGE